MWMSIHYNLKKMCRYLGLLALFTLYNIIAGGRTHHGSLTVVLYCLLGRSSLSVSCWFIIMVWRENEKCFVSGACPTRQSSICMLKDEGFHRVVLSMRTCCEVYHILEVWRTERFLNIHTILVTTWWFSKPGKLSYKYYKLLGTLTGK